MLDVWQRAPHSTGGLEELHLIPVMGLARGGVGC